MAAIPQLNEEDLQQFTAALNDLLTRSEASTALIVEEAGFLIHQSGECSTIDTTQVATLASNAYNATKFMAGIINEPGFSHPQN
jgi:predicted regulator of Ras-like GTPase activity (Roadblock/LC7/MglB family)